MPRIQQYGYRSDLPRSTGKGQKDMIVRTADTGMRPPPDAPCEKRLCNAIAQKIKGCLFQPDIDVDHRHPVRIVLCGCAQYFAYGQMNVAGFHTSLLLLENRFV